jgi:hypothetical protein
MPCQAQQSVLVSNCGRVHRTVDQSSMSLAMVIELTTSACSLYITRLQALVKIETRATSSGFKRKTEFFNRYQNLVCILKWSDHEICTIGVKQQKLRFALELLLEVVGVYGECVTEARTQLQQCCTTKGQPLGPIPSALHVKLQLRASEHDTICLLSYV